RSASAARLKIASATSISIKVKPFSAGTPANDLKPRSRACLADDMHASVAGNVDGHMLLAASEGDAGGLGVAGGIEADAGLAAAGDIRDGALRPVIMRLGPPDVILPPRHLIAAAADLQGDGAGLENGGVARRF